jgi:hypothetical protein
MLFLPILAAVLLLAVAGIQLRTASRALAAQRPDLEPLGPAEPPPLAVLTAPTWAVSNAWRGPDDEG